MTQSPLLVHSTAEAHLYLMATSCSACSAGPLKATTSRRGFHDGKPILDVHATCESCGKAIPLVFDLSACEETETDETDAEPTRINTTMEPSRVLDVGQWIVLFRVIVEAASREGDRTEARRLGYEAAQCLEEAMKFYDPDADSDEPPASAFFLPASRERYERHPEEFSRQRLIDLRLKLPTLDRMRKQIDNPQPAKKWWQIWKSK